MVIVPLQAVPQQVVQVQLNDQNVTLQISQSTYGLFITIWVGTGLIIAGVICQNLNRIVRDTYLGFDGDLAFIDTQGDADPAYTGFGGQLARFQLMYFTAEEIDAL